MLSVIIPAHNEAEYIGPCLDAVLASYGKALKVEILVVANGCSDQTASLARARGGAAAARGWRLEALEVPDGNKPNALNFGDAAASGEIRVYLDADVICGPRMLAQLQAALDRPEPRYASGRLVIAPPRSWVTHHYARLWSQLPFMTDGVPGAGLFAVNAAGRARWGAFPDIISDDTFARLQFAPEERLSLEESYLWPMVEGWRNLVRVRRRQNAGVQEIANRWPEIMPREGKRPLGVAGAARLFLRMPVSFAVYAAVITTVAVSGGETGWTRGR
jgi:glycosyltransferase involved in cell wall biosynthesis